MFASFPTEDGKGPGAGALGGIGDFNPPLRGGLKWPKMTVFWPFLVKNGKKHQKNPKIKGFLTLF